ncbi:hypothetical protein Droror1_Dr00014326 [Drosera rotundifolia]
MTNNGELSIDTSRTPTLQNVDNEGRNTSEHEHVGFCDCSAKCQLSSLQQVHFNLGRTHPPQEAEPTSSFVFSSMTNNGQLDINGSAPPTKQLRVGVVIFQTLGNLSGIFLTFFEKVILLTFEISYSRPLVDRSGSCRSRDC